MPDAPRAARRPYSLEASRLKLSKSTLVVPLAGILLIGAAGVVAAASNDTAGSGAGVVPAAASPSPSATTTTPKVGLRDSILSDVLDDLVAKGTITAAQKTAITDALTAERTARREEARASAEQLRTFLEDGVITQQEFNQLPTDSRLRQLTTLMDDGQITTEELRALGGGLFGGRGHRGFGFHPGFGDDAVPTPSASPTTGS